MEIIDKLYKKDNITIQKSVNLEDKLYSRLKTFIENNFSSTFSDVLNVCIEELVEKENLQYYAKPDDEITIYRSIMIRKENLEALNKINKKTGISITRLLNMAIKEFLDKYENNNEWTLKN